ncbi:serine/threonine protein kinase [Candidatus Parcubacteria bacterium]|nr:serine/threonine protein kinase [Candidatus Parcubacteria bacterium]
MLEERRQTQAERPRTPRPEKPKEPIWPEGFHETQEVPEVEIPIGKNFTDEHGDAHTVLALLGKGGMARAYKVREERTGREMAVKFMNAYSRGTPALVKRFEREIKVLGGLQNPFILHASDVIHTKIDGQEMVGLVMEFVEGRTLAQDIEERGELEPTRIAKFAAQLAVALESLRKAGVIHRDIKPENVLIERLSTSEEIVKLADFGIVGFTSEEHEGTGAFRGDPAEKETVEGHLTRVDRMLGSPHFMSPEAVSGFPQDHRSDLYSFGVLLYDMAAGDVPFHGRDPRDVMLKHITGEVPVFEEYGIRDVPDWLEAIIRKLLEKNPSDRYQTAGEVFAALKEGVRKEYPEFLNEIPFSWDVA